MNSILIYDISDDRLRAKVANVCLDYGLQRIQYSAFLGEMSQNRQQEIMQKLRRQLGKTAVSIQLFPICERDLRLRKTLEVRGEGA